jgi:hypothetical protein
MKYSVACSCGNVLWVSEGMAGSATACRCGRTIQIPSLGELRAQTITPSLPAPFPDLRLTDEPPPGSYPPQAITAALPAPFPEFWPEDRPPLLRAHPLAEILAPTQVSLRTRHGDRPGPAETVLAALTEDALWLQGVWQLRVVPLHALGSITARPDGTELTLAFRPGVSEATLTLTFRGAAVGQIWCRELQTRQRQLLPEAPIPG